MFIILGSLATFVGFGLTIYVIATNPALAMYALGMWLMDLGGIIMAWDARKHGPGGWSE